LKAGPHGGAGAFAIAVISSALGSILLLPRKSAVFYLFIASLLGMIVHMISYLGMAGSTIDFASFEISMYILMPLMVAAFLIRYSKHAKTKSWIS